MSEISRDSRNCIQDVASVGCLNTPRPPPPVPYILTIHIYFPAHSILYTYDLCRWNSVVKYSVNNAVPSNGIRSHSFKLVMKMAVPWVVAPCSLVAVYRCCRGAWCLSYCPGDGGNNHLWNVGKLVPDRTAQHPKDSCLHTRRPESLKSHIVPVVDVTELCRNNHFYFRQTVVSR
jgi:hypothetical protein